MIIEAKNNSTYLEESFDIYKESAKFLPREDAQYNEGVLFNIIDDYYFEKIGSENKYAEYCENPQSEEFIQTTNKIDLHERKLAFYTKTQKWIGHVLNIDKNIFTARLTDLTKQGTDEIGEFYFDEIPDEDKPLISVGSAFYWSVGYAHSENGTITKESLVRFQRTVDLTDDQINEAIDTASRLSSKLKWED